MFRSDPLVSFLTRGKRKETISLELKEDAPERQHQHPGQLRKSVVQLVSPIGRGRAPSSGDAAQIENWALTGAGIVTDWPSE
jgi:hypothetical protein